MNELVETLLPYLSPPRSVLWVIGAIAFFASIVKVLAKWKLLDLSVSSFRFDRFYRSDITNLNKIIRRVPAQQKPFYKKMREQRIFKYFFKSNYKWPVMNSIQNMFMKNMLTEYEILKCKGRFRLHSATGQLYIRTHPAETIANVMQIIWFLGYFVIFYWVSYAIGHIEPMPFSTKDAREVLILIMLLLAILIYNSISVMHAIDYLFTVQGTAKRLDNYYRNKKESVV